MNDTDILSNLVLAPYIMKATALISNERKVGGNQFRHQFYTVGVLLDYKYFKNSVVLKAAMIHDLIEEIPSTNIGELRAIDGEANQVVDLVLEVTKEDGETKAVYLKRILEYGSYNAKLLKVADRISNLVDLNRDNYGEEKMTRYIEETEKYVVPMAREVDSNMVIELSDLIKRKREKIHCLFS
jgi:(p)ppGpp synthase/HD superfamily hydrolase